MRTIKAIPTNYKGIAMRSRLEARFAEWCDTNGQNWIYEPEGFSDGVRHYLPDFYLPNSRLIVEVKPPINIGETDKKIDWLLQSEQFNNYGLAVVSLEPNFFLLRYSEPVDSHELEGSSFQRDWNMSGSVAAGFCRKCGSLHFYGYGSWRCNGCGYYDGDQTHDYSLGEFECAA